MKKLSHRKILPWLIAGLLAGNMVSTQVVFADNLHEKLTTEPGRAISPADERIISDAAAKVLRQIADARSQLHDGDADTARKDLGQARVLIDIIKDKRPTAKVKDHIWVARKHLDYESTKEVATDLIPIEADLTDIEDIVPVATARTHLNRARALLHHGQKAAARKELKAVDDALIYTEVDLPLAATEQHVIAAEKALASADYKQADQLLNTAEDGVRFISVGVTAPITQSRKNLLQASRDYAEKKYDLAKKDLARASAWLKQAGNSTDETTRTEAHKLKASIDTLRQNLDNTGQNAASTLKGLWHRSTALAEREAEGISTGWEKLRTASKAKEDLMDAKLHVTYAETAQFVEGESGEIGGDMEQAQEDMKRASNDAHGDVKARVDTVAREVEDLKSRIGNNDAGLRARYEKVKSDLRQLIKDL